MVTILAIRGDVVITEFSETFFRSIMDKFAGQAVATDGAYRIAGLEPGRYTIVAVAMNPTAARDLSKVRYVTGSVDVSGPEVTLDLAIP